MTPLPRKPRSALRHWSTYVSVSEWYADYHGYVPVQIAAALDRVVREHGRSFAEAYALLLRRGAIIHIDPEDDEIPPELSHIDPGASVTRSDD